MCGTPFPHRALTVPEAQSTLAFTSAPLEVAPSTLSVAAVEAPQPPLENRAVEEEPHPAESAEAPAEPITPEPEISPVEDAAIQAAAASPTAMEPPAPLDEPLVIAPVLTAEAVAD